MSNNYYHVSSIIGMLQLYEENKLQLNRKYYAYTDFTLPFKYEHIESRSLTCFIVELIKVEHDKKTEEKSKFIFDVIDVHRAVGWFDDSFENFGSRLTIDSETFNNFNFHEMVGSGILYFKEIL